MAAPYLYFSFYLKKIALSIRSDLMNFCEAMPKLTDL